MSKALIGIEFEFHPNTYTNIFVSSRNLESDIRCHILTNEGIDKYTETQKFLDALFYMGMYKESSINEIRKAFRVAHILYRKGQYESYMDATFEIRDMYNSYKTKYHLEDDTEFTPLDMDFFIKYMDFPYPLTLYRHEEVSLLLDWDIHQDISTANLLEITSPLLTEDVYANTIRTVLGYIERRGYTDQKCGLHVHITTPELKYLDLTNLLFSLDEDFIFTGFDDRVSCGYCDGILSTLVDGAIINLDSKRLKSGKVLKSYDCALKHKVKHPIVTNEQKESILKIVKLRSRRLGKYCSVNTLNINNSPLVNSHIEFRHLGGENYEKKVDQILERVQYFIDFIKNLSSCTSSSDNPIKQKNLDTFFNLLNTKVDELDN